MKPKAKTLAPNLLRKMDAWWRAANYLSVGQIYLMTIRVGHQPGTAVARTAIRGTLIEH